MWSIIAGAVVGLLLGSAISGEFSLSPRGAIVGALVGDYFFRNLQPAGMSAQERLEQRLLQLEKSVAEQRDELEMLRRLVSPRAIVCHPARRRAVTRTAEPASLPREPKPAAEAPVRRGGERPYRQRAAFRNGSPAGAGSTSMPLLASSKPSAGSGDNGGATVRTRNGRRPARPDGGLHKIQARDRRRTGGGSRLAQVVLGIQPARQDRHRPPLLRRRLGAAPGNRPRAAAGAGAPDRHGRRRDRADRLRHDQGARRQTPRLRAGAAGRWLCAALPGRLLHAHPLRDDRPGAGVRRLRRARCRLHRARRAPGRPGAGGARPLRRLPRPRARRRRRADAAAALPLFHAAQRFHPRC